MLKIIDRKTVMNIAALIAVACATVWVASITRPINRQPLPTLIDDTVLFIQKVDKCNQYSEQSRDRYLCFKQAMVSLASKETYSTVNTQVKVEDTKRKVITTFEPVVIPAIEAPLNKKK